MFGGDRGGGRPHRRSPLRVAQNTERGGERGGVRLHHETSVTIFDQLRRTARIGAGQHSLARRERLERDQAVVLCAGPVIDSATTSQLIEKAALSNSPEEFNPDRRSPARRPAWRARAPPGRSPRP